MGSRNMNSPLERAARVIFETRRDQPPCMAYPAISGEWDAQFRSVKDRYVNEARAVLAAIRGPSEAMLEAARSCDDGSIPGPHPDLDPRETWPAMIDAMLEEG